MTKRKRKKFNKKLYKKYTLLALEYCRKTYTRYYDPKEYILVQPFIIFVDDISRYGEITDKRIYFDKKDFPKTKDNLVYFDIIKINLKNHFTDEDHPLVSLRETVLHEYGHFFLGDDLRKRRAGERSGNYFAFKESKNCSKWIKKNYNKYKVNRFGELVKRCKMLVKRN